LTGGTDHPRILRGKQSDVAITLASRSSPELAVALMGGKVDMAFLRSEEDVPGIAFKSLIRERLVAVLPAVHRLVAQKQVRVAGPRRWDLHLADAGGAGLESGDRELRSEIRCRLKPQYDAEKMSSVLSLVTSTGGVTLMPLYVS
jgi:LysR family transcriptional regulator, hca operon transcriptional activator